MQGIEGLCLRNLDGSNLVTKSSFVPFNAITGRSRCFFDTGSKMLRDILLWKPLLGNGHSQDHSRQKTMPDI